MNRAQRRALRPTKHQQREYGEAERKAREHITNTAHNDVRAALTWFAHPAQALRNAATHDHTDPRAGRPYPGDQPPPMAEATLPPDSF